MKLNSQQGFPYPVLRPESDDYSKDKFIADYEVAALNNQLEIAVTYTLTNSEMKDEIQNGNAVFVLIVSSPETFEQLTFTSQEDKNIYTIDSEKLRGRINLESYVMVKNNIQDFTSSTLNEEYSDFVINYESGDIFAQSLPESVSISRDYFNSIRNVIKFSLNKNIEKGRFEITLGQDDVIVELSEFLHNLYQQAKNTSQGKNILLNALWYPVIIYVVDALKDPNEKYEYKWAEVIMAKIENIGINIEEESSYQIATSLLNIPLLRLADIWKTL